MLDDEAIRTERLQFRQCRKFRPSRHTASSSRRPSSLNVAGPGLPSHVMAAISERSQKRPCKSLDRKLLRQFMLLRPALLVRTTSFRRARLSIPQRRSRGAEPRAVLEWSGQVQADRRGGAACDGWGWRTDRAWSVDGRVNDPVRRLLPVKRGVAARSAADRVALSLLIGTPFHRLQGLPECDPVHVGIGGTRRCVAGTAKLGNGRKCRRCITIFCRFAQRRCGVCRRSATSR